MTQKKCKDKIFADRYTDWETCVQYLQTFHGFITGETGMVTLYSSVGFPSDLHKLPIKKINSPFFDQELPRLPDSLEYLDLPLLTTNHLPELPHGLKEIRLQRFNGVLPKLPDGLAMQTIAEHLSLTSGLEILDLHSFQGVLPALPDCLKKINLHSFRGQLPKLPDYLQELILNVFNEALPLLPDSLKHLELPSFKGELPNLPEGLQYLNLNSFEGNLHHIPNSVETLYLRVYNRQLPKLPDSLRVLSMEVYNHALPKLPDGLQRLNLHWFNGVLPTLPDTLESISIPSYTMGLPNVPQKLDYLVTAHGLQNNFKQLRENLEKKKEISEMYPGSYTNWSVCAMYLSHFKDIKVLDVGAIKLSRCPDFPYDFRELPITTIQSVLYQGGLPELPSRLKKLILQRFDNQLPRLPETLNVLSLKSFKKGLPNIPLNLKIYVNAGGRQNLKDLRQNYTACNQREQAAEQSYSKK
jgi:hypothetical protein